MVRKFLIKDGNQTFFIPDHKIIQLIDEISQEKMTHYEKLKNFIQHHQMLANDYKIIMEENAKLKAELAGQKINQDVNKKFTNGNELIQRSDSESQILVILAGKTMDENSKLKDQNENENFENQEFNENLEEALQILRNRELRNQKAVEMANLLKSAADLGNTKGEVLYGCCLFRGWGVEDNVEEAKRYFHSAASKGNLDGEVWYWICEWENGATHFKAASDAKHPAGAFLYGLCLFYGRSVKKNIKEAQKYFRLSVEYGDSYWAHQYSKILKNGIFHFPKSISTAQKYDVLANQRHVEDISIFYPQFF